MTAQPFLYVVVCAAGNAGDVDRLIGPALERGWGVGVVATPQGLGSLDVGAVEARTGHPVRSAWRTPGDARPLPPADAIAVAPATFNTLPRERIES
ncbi:flavoprotein [Streptomyces sp. SPB074]|nr:flavoprotein [Streptomyces sp. SPB074]